MTKTLTITLQIQVADDFRWEDEVQFEENLVAALTEMSDFQPDGAFADFQVHIDADEPFDDHDCASAANFLQPGA